MVLVLQEEERALMMMLSSHSSKWSIIGGYARELSHALLRVLGSTSTRWWRRARAGDGASDSDAGTDHGG